ncbi:MAG: PLP-dependent transferase [Acetobacteraceae bacterium]
MPDHAPPAPKQAFETRLSHVGRAAKTEFGFVNPPVRRGSTMLYPTCADRLVESEKVFDRGYCYGIYGSTTHHALEDIVAEIEGGTHCQIVSSGLAAVTTPLLAYLSAGDHCLVPDSIYGPSRDFCTGLLTRMA